PTGIGTRTSPTGIRTRTIKLRFSNTNQLNHNLQDIIDNQ
ncbi:uncharacterized protein LOC126830569, partial [Patella vulgata]